MAARPDSLAEVVLVAIKIIEEAVKLSREGVMVPNPRSGQPEIFQATYITHWRPGMVHYEPGGKCDYAEVTRLDQIYDIQ